MPTDARLGLVIGVGLVIAVAVVFFRRDLVNGPSSGDGSPASVVHPPSPPLPRSVSSRHTPVRGIPMSRAEETLSTRAAPRRHTVAQGDSLYDLAVRYYGDGERFVDLYRSNRNVLTRPDQLIVGNLLVIPDLP